MLLTRRIKTQLLIFAVISLISTALMAFNYVGLPNLLFGVGHYTVTMELPKTGGLYKTGNVTYRGTEVGRVEEVRLTDTGVEALLSLKSGINIPSDLRAEVHSQSAIGEQYVELLPRNGNAPPLKNGDIIPAAATSIPPDTSSLLDAANDGLLAIPHDNLKTAIDESYTAIGGLGPELSRIVRGSTALAIDAGHNIDPLVQLIERSGPVLDSQANSASSIQAWASHLKSISAQLRENDGAVAGVLQDGPAATDSARALLDRLQPTLPILMANLVSVGDVALTYAPNLEQLLVLLPQGTAEMQGVLIANLNTPHKGAYLSFNLNVNLPPPCTTGFLPVQQQRDPSFEDYPDRPAGDLYCRTPQDAMFNVRGARNAPCETVPGKRAPTVKMCESDRQYVPLNDGNNWKGDPNGTLSGQAIPQLAPEQPHTQPSASPQDPPPIAVAEYDPATGTYLGPDGRVYRQRDLAQTTPKEQTWQTMLIPPQN